jgi:hypothetical protein
MAAAMELLGFDRDAACPACGIGLEIRGVCRERHANLDMDGDRRTAEPFEHLHVECPACGWTAFMETAAQPPEA